MTHPVVLWDHVENKPFYHQYRMAYDHQIWQDGDLPRAAPTHKFTCSHEVLQDHVTN